MRMVAEGVRTTGAALALGARHGIELPIAAQMAAVLDGRRRRRREAVEVLMGRSNGPKRDQITDHGFLRPDQAVASPRTKQQFVERFDDVVRRADAPEQRSRPIDVETVEALEEALISADVGVAATDRIVAAVRARDRRGASLRELVKAEILDDPARAPTCRRPTATGRTS